MLTWCGAGVLSSLKRSSSTSRQAISTRLTSTTTATLLGKSQQTLTKATTLSNQHAKASTTASQKSPSHSTFLSTASWASIIKFHANSSSTTVISTSTAYRKQSLPAQQIGAIENIKSRKVLILINGHIKKILPTQQATTLTMLTTSFYIKKSLHSKAAGFTTTKANMLTL